MSVPWMPLYVGDYRADTTHLSAAQHGAYLLLIMHYWQQGSLPDDDDQLARIACMTPSEWRRNRSVIRAFFGEGWRHARIDREMKESQEAYLRRSKAGKQGNEKRWGSRRNAIAMGSLSQPQLLRSRPSQGEGLPPSQGMALAARRPALTVVNGSVADDGEDGL